MGTSGYAVSFPFWLLVRSCEIGFVGADSSPGSVSRYADLILSNDTSTVFPDL